MRVDTYISDQPLKAILIRAKHAFVAVSNFIITLFVKATAIVGFIEGLRREFAFRFHARYDSIACNQVENSEKH